MTDKTLGFNETVDALDVRIRAHIMYSSLQMESLLGRFLDVNSHCKRILDMGCGSGNYADLFAKKSSLYVGLDANAGLLWQARQKCSKIGLDNVLFMQWDMNYRFPFVPASFDFIFSGFSAYYVADAEAHVKNCIEILNKGGQSWFVGPASGNAVELDLLSKELFGIPSSKEKDIRIGRLQSEFAPLFVRLFGNCEVSEKDFSLNFPDAAEYAKYYLATPQYVELASKFGEIDTAYVMEKIKAVVGLKLTKKSIFISAKK